MKISKIHVKNFKTFKDISCDFNDFNVIIGECASGKSNFVEIFKFLKDLSNDFLNATSKHNRKLLQNINLSHNPTNIKIVFTIDEYDNLKYSFLSSKFRQKFSIEFNKISYEI